MRYPPKYRLKNKGRSLWTTKSAGFFCLGNGCGIKIAEILGNQDILYQANVDFHRYLEAKGVAHIFTTSDGIHNFDFWGREIVNILDWLLHGEKITVADSGNVFLD